MDQPALAKNRLQQIGIDSPPELVAPAKILLARIIMKEAQPDWLGAARELEAMRALPNVAPALRLVGAYHLGVCKLNTREPEAAAKFFEEAVKGDGPEAQAAAVELAELYLNATGEKGSPQRAKHVAAVELLATALKGVTESSNSAVTPTSAPRTSRRSSNWGSPYSPRTRRSTPALRMIEVYAPLSAPGRDREKRAEVLTAWAVVAPAAERRLQAEGRRRRRRSTRPSPPCSRPRPRRQTSTAAPRGCTGSRANAAKAVETLQKLLQLPQLPDAVTGPAWADLADALIAAKRPDEVWAAFNQIMATATPVSTATRYRLAAQFVETPQPAVRGAGPAALRADRQAGDGRRARSSEFHELALSELAHELIKAEQLRGGGGLAAEADSALYPTGPEAGLGKLFLGICLLAARRRDARGARTPPTRTGCARRR